MLCTHTNCKLPELRIVSLAPGPCQDCYCGTSWAPEAWGFFSYSFISVTFITYFITQSPPNQKKKKMVGRSAAMESIHLLAAPSQHKYEHLSRNGQALHRFNISHHSLPSREQDNCHLLISRCLSSQRRQDSHTVRIRIRTLVRESSQRGSRLGCHVISTVRTQSFNLSASQSLLCQWVNVALTSFRILGLYDPR